MNAITISKDILHADYDDLVILTKSISWSKIRCINHTHFWSEFISTLRATMDLNLLSVGSRAVIRYSKSFEPAPFPRLYFIRILAFRHWIIQSTSDPTLKLLVRRSRNLCWKKSEQNDYNSQNRFLTILQVQANESRNIIRAKLTSQLWDAALSVIRFVFLGFVHVYTASGSELPRVTKG